MSLVELAEQDCLPKFQKPDEETLAWICGNRPAFSCENDFSIDSAYPPDLSSVPIGSLYASSEVVAGIHGVNHARRVSLFAFAVASWLGLPDAEARLVAVAGLLHDTQRQQDQDDPRHGQRAAESLSVSSDALLQQLIGECPTAALAAVLRLHDDPYETIDNNPDYLRYGHLVDVLKTADALDRYRLPKMKWWLRDNRLKALPPEALKKFAFDLIVASESATILGGNAGAVIAAAARALTPTRSL